MRIEYTDDSVTVTLSRRNLLTLLAKLDGHPPDSAAMIFKYSDDLLETIYVAAEEDAVHYTDREPGEMHPATERAVLRGTRK